LSFHPGAFPLRQFPDAELYDEETADSKRPSFVASVTDDIDAIAATPAATCAAQLIR
jgi:hypothetical protein